MSSEQINVKLQPLGIDSSVDELVELCNQNQVQVAIAHEEMGVIENCIFNFLIVIVLSPEFWTNIAIGVISNAFYDSFKYCIATIIKKTKSSSHFNSLKIRANGVDFIVESENISEEIILKGLDTFKGIALSNSSKSLSLKEMYYDKSVVFHNEETGEIEVTNELEFVEKYVAKTKAKEETNND